MNANGRPFSALPDNADARYDHVIVPNPRRRDEIPIGHWPDDAVGESSVSNLPSRSQPWGSTLGHIDPRITDLTTGYPSNMPSWNDTQDSSLPNTDSRGMQPFRSDDMELVMTTTAGAIENAGGYSSNSSLEVNLNCTANTLVEVGTMFNPMDVDGFSAISNFQCDLDAFSNSHIPDGVVPAFGPSSLALPDMDFILFKDADPTNPRIWKCGRNNCAKAFTKRHLYK
ncbi:hypothetical protein H2198_000500 [Neophaeococcomyces mojaviensis]|uniref:Uncharacterized protein n=1 Tax=Neophaeococcomyces mojaviensis TaxID=3383035 RepID=A0ACC3AJM5_9EURO|nr:hypothetical protein H2198_000500 [Knufia sp. JES_112]